MSTLLKHVLKVLKHVFEIAASIHLYTIIYRYLNRMTLIFLFSKIAINNPICSFRSIMSTKNPLYHPLHNNFCIHPHNCILLPTIRASCWQIYPIYRNPWQTRVKRSRFSEKHPKRVCTIILSMSVYKWNRIFWSSGFRKLTQYGVVQLSDERLNSTLFKLHNKNIKSHLFVWTRKNAARSILFLQIQWRLWPKETWKILWMPHWPFPLLLYLQ